MSVPVVAAALLVMLVGMAGIVLPLLPGLPLVWLAAVGSWWIAGMSGAGWVTLAVVTVLLVIGMTAKFVLPSRVGIVEGAPQSSLLVGFLGALAGFVLVPVVGFPLGGVVGLLLAERSRQGDWEPAWDTTLAVLKGYGVGVLIEIAAGVAMITAWGLGVLLAGL